MLGPFNSVSQVHVSQLATERLSMLRKVAAASAQRVEIDFARRTHDEVIRDARSHGGALTVFARKLDGWP